MNKSRIYLGFLMGILAIPALAFSQLSWELMYKYDVKKDKTPPKELSALQGKKVRIPGFVFPLDFESRELSQFLFVPSLGACEHVPPPPANLTVFTTMKKPVPFNYGQPMWLEGVFKIEFKAKDPNNPISGDAQYFIEGTKLENYFPENKNAPKLQKTERKNDVHS